MLVTVSERQGRTNGGAMTQPSQPTQQQALQPHPATEQILAPTIAPNDPIIGYLQSATGAVDLAHLDLDSPALEQLRAQGVALVVPLITSGELVGLLNVGPRLSEQGYSADDRRLLESLATHAAPAIRVGQLIREQQAEMRERGRMEQELRVAQMIQQNFLPRGLPERSGWQIAADYQPARAVGGDFYDFIELESGLLGIVIGDVTDKGIPAAMVMAATKSLLRAAAQQLPEPGDVLARVNDQLCREIPENMFVTCFYGLLDTASGVLRFANAGHNLPITHVAGTAGELRATGMPLGLMPMMNYEVRETTIEPGARLLLYSDGLIEAHDPSRGMFGTDRAAETIAGASTAAGMLEGLLLELETFTGALLEQEDDITLVALVRDSAADLSRPNGADRDRARQILADFSLHSAPGNEREAIRRVEDALAPIAIDTQKLERLKTAVGEATMNAMEHGNHYDPELDVRIVVSSTESEVTVRIVDHGDADAPVDHAETPDIEAKLAGLQSPRGWGLFLIAEMVDSLHHEHEQGLHVIELSIQKEGARDAAGKP